MTNGGIPRLCGGTFFAQLLLSRKPTVSQRQRTQGETDVFHNEDVLFALLRIFQRDAIKPTGNSFETYTTNFKKCYGSIGEELKFENEYVRAAFVGRITDNYQTVLNEMTALCADYIDIRETPRNHEKLVKRLIEIIRDDPSLTDADLFNVGKGIRLNRKALSIITEVTLPDFLLAVWEFVVLQRSDNTIGKDTIVAWSDPKTKGRYTGNDGSSIEQNITIIVPSPSETVERESAATSEDEFYSEYSEPYAEQPTSEPNPHIVNQTINAPAVFFNNGANVMQINNTGTINIDRGGKV